MRRDGGAEPSSTGVLEADRGTLESRGVPAALSTSSSSSSSLWNESLLFTSGFFFFFLGGASLRGVELLLRCDQHRGAATEHCQALTYPSVMSPVEGVALLEIPAELLPSDLSWASRSFCSRTSARRLRKSDRCTRPTVCDLSKSSAETVWLVKDLGVELWLGCSEFDILPGCSGVLSRMKCKWLVVLPHMQTTDVSARDWESFRIGVVELMLVSQQCQWHSKTWTKTTSFR